MKNCALTQHNEYLIEYMHLICRLETEEYKRGVSIIGFRNQQRKHIRYNNSVPQTKTYL